MNNPIPHSSLFITPESLDQLDEYIRSLPQSERPIAYKFTMYAFNLAHKLIEDQKEVA